MSVIRNTFTGTLSANPELTTSYQNHTITGLTSETSTDTIRYVNPEATLHFLNSLYKTIIDAGFGDAVKNDDDYSITVLGFKFYVLTGSINTNYRKYINCYIYTYGRSGFISSSEIINNGSTTPYTDLNYNIAVRGDSNHISIYIGTYNNPNDEAPFLSIARGKNMITSSDIYMFSNSIASEQFIREKANLYSYLVNNQRVYNAIPSSFGLNTNSKFVSVPQMVYNNTILIPSMIQGNTAIFAKGKYYKLGNDIYYNENNYLYKVG